MIRLKNLLAETNLKSAIQKIDKLPRGKIFDDAKNLEGVFKKSKYTWSEVIENFEKNRQDSELQSIKLKNIHITQPNIQSSKVSKMIGNISNLDNINAVQFPDGEIAIYDGHHRLAAHWALGDTNIKVNLVRLKNLSTTVNEGYVLQDLESKYNIEFDLTDIY